MSCGIASLFIALASALNAVVGVRSIWREQTEGEGCSLLWVWFGATSAAVSLATFVASVVQLVKILSAVQVAP